MIKTRMPEMKKLRYHKDDDQGVEIEIEKIRKNSRRIRSKITIEASQETAWNILTDCERLADFIPGLVSGQLLDKRHNFARVFQVQPTVYTDK